MAKIMRLDDNLDMLEMQAAHLRSDGHHVMLATNGPAALAGIQTLGYDLLVNDIIMPEHGRD